MAKNDWYEAGDQIRKIVQDAVESGDYTQLGNTISGVVNEAVDGIQSVLKESLNNIGTSGQGGADRSGGAGGQHGAGSSGGAGGQYGDAGGYDEDRHYGASGRNRFDDIYGNEGDGRRPHNEAAERIRRNMRERDGRRGQAQGSGYDQSHLHVRSRDELQRPVKSAKLRVPGELSGKIMKWCGYSLSSIFGLALGILIIIGVLAEESMVAIPAGVIALLFGTSFCVGRGGSSRVALATRFRKYKEILGTRTYCLIEELANGIGESSKFVRKDLKKMIGRGFFKEGYLDGKKTLLMTSRETYQQYLTTQAEYERGAIGRSAAAEDAGRTPDKAASQEPAGEKPRRKLSPECRELIEEGRRYIQHIHECNDKIEDEQMSSKLDRLELVITRIFREAEKDDSVVSDLKKMMSYYLPTTRKLLDAYCEMDAQPIRGQNIETTKKEIEDALDTINSAFEKMFDSFFEEKAWDISSDISVLNTMFAQEGLTGKDFQTAAR